MSVLSKTLSGLFFLSFFLTATSIASAASFRFDVINIGQGDGIFVQSPAGKTMLIDCGDNGKGSTVINYLKSMNVSHLDFMVSSHYHADHIGCSDEILKSAEITVGKVLDGGESYDSQTFTDYVNAAGSKREVIGDAVDMGLGITVNVLKKRIGSDENGKSLVLTFAFNKLDLISGGDCTSSCEKYLLDNNKLYNLEVYKVHHHGSKYSSTKVFLDVILPEVSVISVGVNSYGHPAKETLDRLKAVGSAIYRTDKNDNVQLTSEDGITYKVVYKVNGKTQTKTYTAS